MNEHQKKTKTLTHKHTVTDVRETRLSESNYHNRINTHILIDQYIL
jgi:hypothetical protein